MKLSVIIVNYNVKYFLEHCLHSVYKALSGIETEVWVVDNNSVDGSCQMVKEKFPQVLLIENKANTGFSKANNQAIRKSQGKYILLLNPDTVVEEDTFSKCCKFMDSHPEAGALGVKMIDGKGNFLPESKRALPTPLVAFYKIFGFSKIFPKSKKFGRYHLSYLDKDKNHEVEILAGAFMFIRKETLDKVGLLDEAFFMYGEDIDLSYRIIKGGYKNYYIADTAIIHYKGESTKKSSVNYVLVFYNAMQIFARKHFRGSNASLYILMINFAIWFRAGIAIGRRFIKTILFPVVDFIAILVGLNIIKHYWSLYHFGSIDYYPPNIEFLFFPAISALWLSSIYLTGSYSKPYKLSKTIIGILFGTLFILATYALLPDNYRFSRMLIILGTCWTIISILLLRIIYHFSRIDGFKLNHLAKKKIAIVGFVDEATRVENILNETSIHSELVGSICPNLDKGTQLGSIDQIEELIELYKVEELIFCAKDMPSKNIISTMFRLSKLDIEFKIAPPESLSIIGSNSINTSGELYLIDLNSINTQSNRRKKRFLDIVVSIILIVIFPILLLIVRFKLNALLNILKVLGGKKTWVGYTQHQQQESSELPKLNPCIFSPIDSFKHELSADSKEKLNFLYAKDYKISNDINIIARNVLYIGKK